MEFLSNYFDLRKSFPFYGAYHREWRNILIHIVGVPTIAITTLYFFSHIKMTSVDSLLQMNPTTAQLIPKDGVSFADIFISFYAFSYLFMEPVAATLYMPFLYGMRHLGCVELQGKRDLAIALHVVAWISQFIGHGVFEKRKPALMDNLLQAVHGAPMLVWLEVLFFLGYRPALQKELDALCQVELAKVKKAEAAKVIETRKSK